MEPLGNDRWRASFVVDEIGRHEYTVAAWADHWVTWRTDLVKRLDAGQDVTIDLKIGANLVDRAVRRAAADGSTEDAGELERWAARLREGSAARGALDDDLDVRMRRHPDRDHVTTFEPALGIVVDPVHARFSSWYELFPRSTSPKPGRHGTLRDVIDRLAYVGGLGFDVLYLPPIHPIGTTFRKGPNNVTSSGPSDPGVPGRSAARTVDTRRSTVTSAPSRTSTRSSRRPVLVASASRLTSRSRSRPTTRSSASTRPGSASAPTARSSTRRTRRRNTRTSTRSISSRRTGRPCGTSCARSSSSGSGTASRSSGSTTRTPRRFRSGNGPSASSSEPTRRHSSWPRRSPGLK